MNYMSNYNIHYLAEYYKIIRNLAINRPAISNKNIEHKDPFFIIGSGRSGNTLLRSILTANPLVAIPPESYVIYKAYLHYKVYRFLAWPELVQLIISDFESHPQFFNWNISLTKCYQRCINLPQNERSLASIIMHIYREYSEAHFPEAIFYGDKTPLNTLHLDEINHIFPRAKYIHLVRDGRDVVSSYIKMGRYSNIEDAAERWNSSIDKALKFKKTKGLNTFLEIKYEDLVTNSESVIKNICNFLAIPYDISMIKRDSNLDSLGDVRNLKHHGNVMNPISTNSIGNWEKNLNNKEKQNVLKLLKYNLWLYGY